MCNPNVAANAIRQAYRLLFHWPLRMGASRWSSEMSKTAPIFALADGDNGDHDHHYDHGDSNVVAQTAGHMSGDRFGRDDWSSSALLQF